MHNILKMPSCFPWLAWILFVKPLVCPGIERPLLHSSTLLWGCSPTNFIMENMWWARTCLEVGDDRATGQGSFGGIQGHSVAGARLEVGQLVLLLVALDKERVSCHWKTVWRLQIIYRVKVSGQVWPFLISRISTLINFTTFSVKQTLFRTFCLNDMTHQVSTWLCILYVFFLMSMSAH